MGDEIPLDGGHKIVNLARAAPRAIDVEIAIGTDARAERPMDIDPKRRRRRRHHRAAFSFSKATARWLMASLSAGFISPKVREPPVGVKMGS